MLNHKNYANMLKTSLHEFYLFHLNNLHPIMFNQIIYKR